jgi:hypothetical protein
MQNQNPKSQSIASRLPITRGEKAGSGHFYLAQNRTFLLCVDMRIAERRDLGKNGVQLFFGFACPTTGWFRGAALRGNWG